MDPKAKKTVMIFKTLVRCRSGFRFYSKIRNVGIIAHIDAGKTTLTERMLYYSGFLKEMGEVHKGDTKMDYMDQEKERGITITSAAISFSWQDHNINLIDTPGHVDFTIEVERALRVLDGGVVLLDGSAGVEAQTMTVWRQAQRYQVPCIAFINKIDKTNSNLEMTLTSMKNKLGLTVLLTQIPLKPLNGIIDLIHMKSLTFENRGCEIITKDMMEEHAQFEEASKYREILVEQLSEINDDIANLVISNDSYDIPPEPLEKALKNVVLESKALVTFCGSAFKNIGVQPLINAINLYLPNPKEIQHDFLNKITSKDLCAMAFKIVHHPNKGILTYIRIYSGKIREGDTLYNLTRDCSEKISRIAIAYANDYQQVKEAVAGNIVVINGLKETITGDTLVSKASFAKLHPELKLAGVHIPDPVFFCSIEAPSMSTQKALDIALSKLAREDPSLGIEINEDVNDQTILSGMGELHLEVILKRIRQEYKIDADLGPLMVAYKETPHDEAFEEIHFERKLGDRKHEVSIGIEVKPLKDFNQKSKLNIIRNELLKPGHEKALEKGFFNGMFCGPLLNFPVLGAMFIIKTVEIRKGTSETMISAAMTNAVKAVLKKANVGLLEPMMKLVIQSDPGMS